MKILSLSISVFLIIMLTSNFAFTQVAINDHGTAPDASSGLDIDFTNKGILIPRIDFNNKPASPATGLMIYVTANGPKGNNAYYYYDGSNWSKVSGAHFVGESLYGGKVFWVDTTGQHGLIAATADQSSGISYLPQDQSYKNTMARGNGIWAGERNTTLIIAKQGFCGDTNYAARLCAELEIVSGGYTYSGWYLPSKKELTLMYNQKTVIGGFGTGYYWSSNESDHCNASAMLFTNGTFMDWWDKWDYYNVRCIRKF